MVQFSIFGEVIEFHEDLKRYYQISSEFEKNRSRLAEKMKCEIDNQSNPDEILEKIDSEIATFIDILIDALSDHNIFNKTKNDFLSVCDGYQQIINSTSDCLNYLIDSINRRTEEAEINKAQENFELDNSVTGLGFTVISSNLIENIVYQTMNRSEMKRQYDAAAKRWKENCSLIAYTLEAGISTDKTKYYKNVYLPQIMSGIAALYKELLACYVRFLSEKSLFDLDCLEKIDYERSNEILQNISKRKNKQGLILESIKLCPFNKNIYYCAHRNYLYNNGLSVSDIFGDIIRYFELDEKVSDLLVPAEDLAENAERLLADSNYAKAEEAYRVIVDLYPNSPYGWHGLILCETKVFTSTEPRLNYVHELWGNIPVKEAKNESCSRFNDAYHSYLKQLDLLTELCAQEKTLLEKEKPAKAKVVFKGKKQLLNSTVVGMVVAAVLLTVGFIMWDVLCLLIGGLFFALALFILVHTVVIGRKRYSEECREIDLQREKATAQRKNVEQQVMRTEYL